ncbi:MAG: indole-3-glycerol phosphate synthase TrpC [Akkermansiaceae bacterium]|nr:indole-3-glycerol phosphate synthase TrpC [Akkermansiaceae bacterium]
MTRNGSNKLDEILAHKRRELERLLPQRDKLRAAASGREDFRSFFTALGGGLRDQSEDEGYGAGELAVIAEVKKASPSAGVIAEDFDPVAIAEAYAAAGANAISVLTDEKFFQGHLSYLTQIRQAVGVPLLRKDFIVDETQIYEAVVAGADAVLLIVAALTDRELEDLLKVAEDCQLDALVEVHDLDELDRALDTDARIIGVNNRNLKTFEVSLETTERLSQELGPDYILVSESGVHTAEDAGKVRAWGADAILVGEALMRAGDKAERIAAFKNAPFPAGIGRAE